MCDPRPPAEIAGVEVLSGFRLRLTFADGVTKVKDLGRSLRGPISGSLRADPALFAAVRVDPELGTIVRPNGADICPDLLRYDLPLAGPVRKRAARRRKPAPRR